MPLTGQPVNVLALDLGGTQRRTAPVELHGSLLAWPLVSLALLGEDRDSTRT